MRTIRIPLVGAIATIFTLVGGVLAEGPSRVPARQPLTYRDACIYGWWQPYFWEGPFDFIITQAIVLPGNFGTPGTNNASDLEHIKIWNESLKKARAAGKRVMVVCSPGQGKICTEPYFKALEQFLDNIDHQELYAISLSEENICSAEYVAALTDGYHRIKKKYPDLPVFQWYTCSSRADARPGFTWPLLPSDGWLADEYVASPEDFEQAVRRYRMLGLDFIHIIWASPYTSGRETSVEYHSSIFAGQVRVSQKYNIPTAYYCWDGDVGGRTWAWIPEGPKENRELFKTILENVSKAKALEPEALLDWDDAAKPLPTSLAKQTDGSFSYRESYDLWSGLPGAPPPPAQDFMSRSHLRGLRHMTCSQNPSRILVHADGDKPVDAGIVNHWVAPQGESLKFTASANVIVEASSGAEVLLEVSPNGYDWVARTAAKESGVLKLDLAVAQSEMYTRVRVIGTGAANKPLAAIDWIEVRGVASK